MPEMIEVENVSLPLVAMDKPLLCIGGPSGAGKDTLLRMLLEWWSLKERFLPLEKIPRATTRRPRRGEIDGVDYFFLSEEEFDRRKKIGAIVAVDCFCGNKYGIDLQNIFQKLGEGKQIVGVFGICSFALRDMLPKHTKLIYITAPIEVLRERLIERGDLDWQCRVDQVKRQQERELPQFDQVIENIGPIEESFEQLLQSIGLITAAVN